MQKFPKKIVIITVAVIVLLLLAIPKITFLKSEQKNEAPQKRLGSGGISVEVSVVKNQKISENIFSSGTLIANEEAELKSEVSGRIVKIYFKEGSRVNKGDLLVKINDSELQAQLKKAESRKNLAQDKEYRYKTMFEKELVSKEEYDVAVNELNSVEADIQLIKAQLEKTEIRAPFNGIIGLRSVSEGSYVSPASTIASIQNINPIKIEFSIPEKYFNQIKIGSQIDFGVQGVDKKFSGKIYAIEPKVDRNTRTIMIRAISENSKSELFPGAFANIEIKLNEIQNTVLIPTQALIPDAKGVKVFVAKSGKAVPVKVQTGIRNESEIQITNGLKEGDSVITSGILQLRPNVPVKVKNVN